MENHPVTVADDHDVCEHTGYCRRCGIHDEFAAYHGYLCASADNVIAISHLRALRIRIEALAKKRTHLQIVQGHIDKLRSKFSDKVKAPE